MMMKYGDTPLLYPFINIMLLYCSSRSSKRPERMNRVSDLRFTMDEPEVRHSGSFDILVHFLCKKRTLQTYDSIISLNYRLTEHPGDSSDRKGLITCMEKVQHLEGDIK